MRLRRLLFAMVTMIVAIGFTSCDSDDYYLDPALYGRWTLDSNMAIDRYTFYDDGTGFYEGMNEWGQWDNFRIDWHTSGNLLYVYFIDARESWSFYYRFEYDRGYQYLVLNNRDNGQDYWYY